MLLHSESVLSQQAVLSLYEAAWERSSPTFRASPFSPGPISRVLNSGSTSMRAVGFEDGDEEYLNENGDGRVDVLEDAVLPGDRHDLRDARKTEEADIPVPDDVLKCVFLRLPLKQYPHLSLVNRRWRSLSLSPSLWLLSFQAHWGVSLSLRCNCCSSAPAAAQIAGQGHANSSGVSEYPIEGSGHPEGNASDTNGGRVSRSGSSGGSSHIAAEEGRTGRNTVAAESGLPVSEGSSASEDDDSPGDKGSMGGRREACGEPSAAEKREEEGGAAGGKGRGRRARCAQCQPSFSALCFPEFAQRHTVGPGECVVGLAIKYGVEASNIRRLNNMMSDHALHSRPQLLIPIPPSLRAARLPRQPCRIHFDAFARRGVFLVGGEGDEMMNGNEMEGGNGDGSDMRGGSSSGGRGGAPGGRGRGRSRVVNTEGGAPGVGREGQAGSERVLLLVQRALRVDDATARFYLQEGGGDVRQAVALFQRDREWEEERRQQR